jgi:hypothetical protein
VNKCRFFETFDARTRESRSVATKHGITHQTACTWLKQRRIQGSPAYRRSRKLSTRLGRQPSLTNDQIQRLLSPSTLFEINITSIKFSILVSLVAFLPFTKLFKRVQTVLDILNQYYSSSFQIATKKNEKSTVESIKRRPSMILGKYLLYR